MGSHDAPTAPVPDRPAPDVAARDRSHLPAPAAGRRTKLVGLALLALWLLYLVPIWLAPALPFVDLPWHLASATVVRDYRAPGNDFAEIYALKLFPRPNVLHLAFTSARLFPSVEFANRVFYSLYALAVPGLLLLLVRAYGGSDWFALLGFLLLYNFSTNYGFTEFTAGIPIILMVLLALTLQHRRPTALNTLAAMAALAALYFAHAMAAMFGILFALAYALVRPVDRWRSALGQVLVPLPAIFLMGLWSLRDPGGAGHTRPLGWLIFFYKRRFLPEWPERLLDFLTLDNRALFGPRAGPLAAAAFACCVLIPLAYGAVGAWRGAKGTRLRLSELRADRRLPLFAFVGCAAALFVLVPPGVPPYWNFYQRFSAFIFLGAIVLGSTLRRRILPDRLLAMAAVALVVAHGASWGEHILAFGKEARDLDALLPPPETGRVLCPIVKDVSYYRGEPEVFLHFVDYYTVWRKGVVAMQFGAGSSPVWRRVGLERLPTIWNCLPDRNVDYAVVRADAAGEALDREGFALQEARGEWRLYHRPGRPGG